MRSRAYPSYLGLKGTTCLINRGYVMKFTKVKVKLGEAGLGFSFYLGTRGFKISLTLGTYYLFWSSS